MTDESNKSQNNFEALGCIDIDRIYPNNTYTMDQESESNNDYMDKLLVYGFIKGDKCLKLSEDIIHIIYLYSLNIKARSITVLSCLYLFASTIHNIMNLESNRCEFVNNKTDELNLLQYIYVRGGMCRDILLNRNIEDIDIVLNIQQLSKQYLSHLTRFHSQKEQQQKHCKCILWQHYLNKFGKDESQKQKQKHKRKDIKEFKKVRRFERMIQKSDYLLNAKFIKTLVFSTDLFQNAYDDKYNNIFDSKRLGLSQQRELVRFDIVDQMGCHDNYGSIVSMELYRKAMGDETVKKALESIDEYTQRTDNDKENISIAIPIYPFEFTVNLYDCTINCFHIDLWHILKDKRIDLLWQKKICETKYNNDIINKYNNIGYKHLKHKILIAPNLNAITNESAEYYFWRLVKMVTKFIHKLISKEWCIDESYLNTLIHFYDVIGIKPNERRTRCRVFHTKCLYHGKGGTGTINGINTRFVVFRYIQFEQYLKSKWDHHGAKFKQVLLNQDIKSKYRRAMLQCFHDFGYRMNITMNQIPKGCYDHL